MKSKNFFLFMLFIFCFSRTGMSQQIDKTLYSLHITRDEFNDIYENSGDENIVLQFTLDDSSPLLFTLSAWASKNHDYNEKIPEAVFKIDKWNSIDADANTFFGDQQIKPNAIKKIYKLFNPKPPSPPSIYKYLIFDPKIDPSTKHIYYKVSLSDVLEKNALNKKPIGSTDPSPPAHSY